MIFNFNVIANNSGFTTLKKNVHADNILDEISLGPCRNISRLFRIDLHLEILHLLTRSVFPGVSFRGQPSIFSRIFETEGDGPIM